MCSGRLLRDVVTEDPKALSSDLVQKIGTLKSIQEKMERRRLLADEDVPEEIEVEYPPDFNDDGEVIYEDGETEYALRANAFDDDEEAFEVEVEDEDNALPRRQLRSVDDEDEDDPIIPFSEDAEDGEDEEISPEDEIEVEDEDDIMSFLSDFDDDGDDVEISPEDEIEVEEDPLD